MKKIFIIVSLFFVLILIAVAVMFFSSWCPPVGPWPTPPWCAVSKDFAYRQLDYINYPADGKKLSLGVGTMDIWGNPHWFINLGEDTENNYSSAMRRIGLIGSSSYLFTDFINLGQGTAVDFLDKKTFPATYNIESGVLGDLVAHAQRAGQKRVFMLTNLSDTANEIEGFIGSAKADNNVKEMLAGQAFKALTERRAGLTSAESLKLFDQDQWSDFLKNLQQVMVEQAKKAQAAGVTDFVINPGDVIVDYYTSKDLSAYWQEVAVAVRQVFSGRVGFFGYPDVLSRTKLTGLDFVVVYFEVRGDKAAQKIFSQAALEPSALKSAWQDYFSQDFWRKLAAEKILLVTIPSYKGAKSGGWIEPGELHSDLEKNYQEQALLYEALFEVVAGQDQPPLIISYGYWWSPNMYPKSKPLRNDLSHSIRNKDAENIFYHWATKH